MSNLILLRSAVQYIGQQAVSIFEWYFVKKGGLEIVVREFISAGLGEVVRSWVSNGPNKPITVVHVESVVGVENLKQIAAATGLPVQTVASLFVQHLPTAIDKMTPEGRLPSEFMR